MASIPIARYPSVSEMGYSPLGSFLEGGLSGFQTGYGLKRDTVDRKRKKELEDQRMQMQQEELGVRKKESEARLGEIKLSREERTEDKEYRRGRDKRKDELDAALLKKREAQEKFQNNINSGYLTIRQTESNAKAFEASRANAAEATKSYLLSEFKNDIDGLTDGVRKVIEENSDLAPYLNPWIRKITDSKSGGGKEFSKSQEMDAEVRATKDFMNLEKREKRDVADKRYGVGQKQWIQNQKNQYLLQGKPQTQRQSPMQQNQPTVQPQQSGDIISRGERIKSRLVATKKQGESLNRWLAKIDAAVANNDITTITEMENSL